MVNSCKNRSKCDKNRSYETFYRDFNFKWAEVTFKTPTRLKSHNFDLQKRIEKIPK